MVRIKKSVLDLVLKKYQIIELIDLCEVDHDPRSLVDRLSPHASPQWNPDQKLVILHHETDYYPNINSIGNTVYNFFRLCANFCIPLESIIFFTNHYGLQALLHKFVQEICNETGLTVIETSQWYDMPDSSVDSEISDIVPDKLYACLNGAARRHRVFTLCALSEYGLLPEGIVSYHFGNSNVARTS
jgi:hypothetical protein